MLDRVLKYIVPIVLIILLPILLIMASNSAINVDEVLHYGYANEVVDWFESDGANSSCLTTPKTNLKYYGQSVDNLSAYINRTFDIDSEYATRHYIGAFIGWLLLIVIASIALEVTGSRAVALLSIALFIISPRPMGQLFGNLKDIPFALGYSISVLYGVKILKRFHKPKWLDVISMGLGIAFANSIRFGGFVVLLELGLVGVTWIAFKAITDIRSRLNSSTAVNRDLYIYNKNWWLTISIKVVVVTLIGYLLALIFWPYGQIDIIHNPLEALRVMEHYKVSIRQIFMGEVYWSTDLPWYYITVWLFISIPEIVLIGFIAGVVISIYKRESAFKQLPIYLLLLSTIFPIVYVILKGSNLYSGWRQFYFIYPTMVVLASIGSISIYKIVVSFLDRNIVSKVVKRALVISNIAIFVGLGVAPIIHTVDTYPTEYVYFNSFVGGVEGAWSRFELDYYFHNVKKGVDWLIESGELKDGDVVASHIDIRGYTKSQGVDIEYRYIHINSRNSVEWDYAILESNYVTPYRLSNNSWQYGDKLKEFTLGGKPNVVVVKGQSKSIVKGIEAYSKGNFKEAIVLLNEGLSGDVNDIESQAMLGASYLNSGEVVNLDLFLDRVERLAPDYENFYLLRASLLLSEGRYSEAQEICEQGLSINSKDRSLFNLREKIVDRDTTLE